VRQLFGFGLKKAQSSQLKSPDSVAENESSGAWAISSGTALLQPGGNKVPSCGEGGHNEVNTPKDKEWETEGATEPHSDKHPLPKVEDIPTNKDDGELDEAVRSISVVGTMNIELNLDVLDFLQEGIHSNDGTSVGEKIDLKAEDIGDDSGVADVDTAVSLSIVHSLRSHEQITTDGDSPAFVKDKAKQDIDVSPSDGDLRKCVHDTSNEEIRDDFCGQRVENMKFRTSSLSLNCDRDAGNIYLTCSEKQKLEGLIKMQENGDDIDEEELYELELRDRFATGEKLIPEELDDLNFILQRRKKQGIYRNELEVLRSKIEAGEPIDEARYYFLELVEKQRLGHSLNEEELADIEDFEAEEDDMYSEDKSDPATLEQQQIAKQPAMDVTMPLETAIWRYSIVAQSCLNFQHIVLTRLRSRIGQPTARPKANRSCWYRSECAAK
jgi:hypothetical protein